MLEMVAVTINTVFEANIVRKPLKCHDYEVWIDFEILTKITSTTDSKLLVNFSYII